MSKETIKTATVITIGAVALTSAINAHATTIVSADADQTATFTGQSNFNQNGISINCELNLTGVVSKINGGSDIMIEVTDGITTGGVFSGCNLIELDFNPAWTAVIQEANVPSEGEQVSLEFDDVSVGTGYFGPCLSTNNNNAQNVPALYSNGSGSSSSSPNTVESVFDYATTIGICTVSGTIEVDLSDDIDIYEP